MFGSDTLAFVIVLHLAIALPLCGHILLTKDSEPVAIGWIALVLLSPFAGSLFYGLFGINRIARKARKFRRKRPTLKPHLASHAAPVDAAPTDHERQIFQFARSVHEMPFVAGNRVEPLVNGDAAFPAMLAAIEGAARSIALSVYIFDYDPTGVRFIAALTAAHKRGVAVRVLVDDVGLLYSTRAVDRELAAAGVSTARFVPRSLRFLPFLNLRNHRKLLLIDGREAFIGGMNIRHGNMLNVHPRHPVQDIHFRVTGPVIDQMNTVFEEDWLFATNQDVVLPPWQPAAQGEPPGGMLARIAPDGPDDNFEKLQWIILGALAVARKNVHVMTPYFLPNEIIVSALMVAALRGVAIEIVVPRRSNIPFMDSAMATKFERLLEHGIKIYRSNPPFDHSKLMVVDGLWSLVGSTNWDQRSLRLNFEANLECYNAAFGAQLEDYFAAKKAAATPIDLRQLKATPLAIRLRNNLIRLFSSYL
jgi:cardiolipin synthase